jgi:hypothetical protein
MDQIIICERCWRPINARSSGFIRLGHLADVRDDGEPVFVFAYLHDYEPETGECAA